MRVLSVTWNIFTVNNGKKELARDGGSLMIHDICEAIGKKVDSFLLLGSFRTSKEKWGNINIIDNSSFLPGERTKANIETWQRGLLNCFRNALEELRPDYVFVHGGGEFSLFVMQECIMRKQPFSFVNHLMASGNAGYVGNELEIQWEKEVYNLPDIHVIAVGEGMRKKILSENKNLKEEQVSAIPNGTFIDGKKKSSSLRKELEIGEKKVLLCVGSIQPRKNQRQLVKAYCLLDEEIKNDLVVIFCGNKYGNGEYLELLINDIQKAGLEKNLIYVGSYPRAEMNKLYSMADGLVMPSLSEGLSLVAVEMIRFGKPIIMYRDNETAADFDNTRVCLLSPEHDDESLRQTIQEWYQKKWDESYIKEYSSYFSMDRVAEDYIRIANDRKMELVNN